MLLPPYWHADAVVEEGEEEGCNSLQPMTDSIIIDLYH
jgi:hypothetical protein